MEFRLLGPLEASHRGRRIPLGGPKQRAVLAHLLVHANRVVSTDRLIDDVWSGEPPEAARNALQSYVSRLRQTLRDGARIERRPPGYVLQVEPDGVDAHQFEVLVDAGADALPDDPEGALHALDDALGLWRGTPLADLADELPLRPEIRRLEELRLAAVEDRAAAKLALGRHDELAAELESLLADHPLRERLWMHLMLALYRSGRQSEALEAYRRARRLLADELGLDPSPDLRELQGRILHQDATLDLEAQRLRGYRLLEQIGAGTFGIVRRALQPHVGREVAVKVITPALANDARFVRRFEAEAQLVARLEHPRIVPLYDYWREPDGAYLVMRLLRGGSLRSELEKGPLAPDRAAAVIGHVAAGLAVAHRQGIVHRDVKPANILLDEDGNAYLSDFGIATDVATELVPPSPETIAYLSPEQARGEAAGARADVYSLGVVLREALGDRAPPRLEAVIARATADDPADRYADAEAVLDALLSPSKAEPRRAQTLLPARNPYRGLRPFEEADADDFFGREALVERLVGRLAAGERFLALVGPSGSGKSSAVRAGLFPALRGGAVPGSRDWFLVETSPGRQPLEDLEEALRRVAVDPPDGAAGESSVLVFVDQLEELYTLHDDAGERDRFLALLAEAAADPLERVRVVVALRADLYDRPLEHPAFAALLRVGVETVVPLSPEELERAVGSPALRVGVACDPGLVAEIVADVTGRAGALPLLQYALTELFERRRDGAMTLAGYRELGGLGGAVARRAEELYEAAGEDGRKAARELFLRLVTLAEGPSETRRRVSRSELASLEVDQAALEQVLESFGRHRLLSFDRDPQTRAPTVELAHEALPQAWTRLRGWIEEARGDVRMRARLAAAAREWNAAGRDASFLLTGSRLGLFDAWAPAARVALARSERDFLQASRRRRDAAAAEDEARRAREAALERRSRRRLRALVAVLALAALAAAGLSAFALDQRGEARDEAARAERAARVATARELAAAAVAHLEGDPELAILLALEAVETTRATDGTVAREAEEALHRAVQASRAVLSVPGLFGLAFSPDGTRLATSNADGTARVWDVATGVELVRLTGHTARTLSVDFSPDGTLIATSSEDGTAKLWDAETGEELRTFVGHEAGLRSPHFSPDGTILATTSFDGTTRLWDVATARQLRVLAHTGGVEFSPDGTRLVVSDPPIAVHEVSSGRRLLVIEDGIPDPRDATWSGDGSRIAISDGDGFGYVFDARTGERLLTLVGHGERSVVGEIAFSADDRRLVTSGSDGTVRVWDAQTGRVLLTLRGLQGNVEGSVFSPDGTLVAGSSGSGVAKVWDVTAAGSREIVTVRGHRDVVYGLGVTPDGRRLATASVDGSAGVWDARTGERVLTLEGLEGRIEDLAVSPDGARLLTGGPVARVWDAMTGRELSSLPRHGGSVLAVAFSPDGTRLATGGEDGTATVWDAATGDQVALLSGHTGMVLGITFDRDGARLATASQDETARVWDATTGEELALMSRHDDNVNAVAFGREGVRLYTAGEDGVLKVWDAESGRELDRLAGHAAGLLDIALDADANRLATASRDGTVKLWDAGTHTELLAVSGHESGVSSVVFTPDGDRLVAGAEDGSVRVFALVIDELVDLARERLTRPLSEEECRQYLHRERCPG